MRKAWHGFAVSLGVLLTAACAASAAEIEVAPGESTLEAALARARPADVLKLAAGEYRGSVRVPEGVTVRGAGPDKTKVTGTGHILIRVTGARVTIAGIELQAGTNMERGVDSDSPVRIESCRFVRFPHGVALAGAPLADVIACEFKECDIGVRAIAKASPTVWGCRFEGGGQGIFVMDGAPYIRNNLFLQLNEGILLVSEDSSIIRNNVFWKCKAHGVLVARCGDTAVSVPSIRNNIFVACGDAVAGPAGWLSAVSHCVVHESGNPPIVVEPGQPAIDLASRHVMVADPGLSLNEDGTVALKKVELTKGQGIRLCGQPADERGDIGLESKWNKPGCWPRDAGELPPARFTGPIFLANAVAEEYVLVRGEGCEVHEQALDTKGGKRLDILRISCAGRAGERKFDIGRFFGESFVDGQ